LDTSEHGYNPVDNYAANGTPTLTIDINSFIGMSTVNIISTNYLIPDSSLAVPLLGNQTTFASPSLWSLTQPPALPTHPERLRIATTLEEYLQRLPTNEQHLFASLDLMSDPFEILATFNQEYLDPIDSDDDTLILDNTPTPPTTIHMVSDGSELSQKMIFVWV
jgi:hypothetical protein